ncbi:hypothetical protein [Pseudolactococcus reticulitermitis]
MNNSDKEQIKKLRQYGLGYKRVAKMLNISVDTVKSFCRKNNLSGMMAKPKLDEVDCCRQCGDIMMQVEKKKPLKFCKDECRKLWWQHHRSELKKKKACKIICQHCGKEVMAYRYENRKYCSHQCYCAERFKEGE